MTGSGFGIRINKLENFFIRLALNCIFNYMGVESLPPLELLVELNEIVRLVIKLKSFIFRWKAVFDKSARNIGIGKLHNFLKIDMPNIIHNPLDFNVVDVDTRGHAQIVYDLVGHELYILSRLTHHHLVTQFIISLHVLITGLKLPHSTNQHHRLALCTSVEIMVDSSRA
jgi:hypothetical protein